MKILIAYYSLTGHTRALAQELGGCLQADVEEISDVRKRGPFGTVMHAWFANLRKREPALATPRRNVVDYDLVLIGGPVWARHIAPQVRAYARLHGARASQVAFFCTLGGQGAPTAFAELETACGRAPVATLAVDEPRLSPPLHADAARLFMERVRAQNTASVVEPATAGTRA